MFLAVVLYAFTYAPKIGEYLQYRVEFVVRLATYPAFTKRFELDTRLPVWVAVLVCIGIWAAVVVVKTFRRRRVPKVVRKTVYGLDWDVQPLFFDLFDKIEQPGDVDDFIKGPYSASSC
jgi:hypothetical protein